MDAERPSPDPRPTTRHQTTPRPADSFVQSAKPAPNELAIWRSGGCRVLRAGRGAEITPDRSASSLTREVSGKPALQPVSPDGIHWRQRPRTERLQRIRSSRPGRSTRHHPMLEALYWHEIPDWYYAFVIFRPATAPGRGGPAGKRRPRRSTAHPLAPDSAPSRRPCPSRPRRYAPSSGYSRAAFGCA